MTIDTMRYRQVLGHFPTGITIVTGLDAAGLPHGLTIGSFTSVSLVPPLVGFLPMLTTERWQTIAPSGTFCVNVLGIEHADLCWRFARSGDDDRFDDVEWAPAPSGSPVIAGVVAWIDCKVEFVHEIGDHYFVVGRITDLAHTVGDFKPLVFCRGKLGTFHLAG
jgi:3-hydroxy-9,10-secoandrosta-1,3,5(10)-triene-9,17-dione monooxygenase reductase component